MQCILQPQPDIRSIITQIRELYLADSRPWIVGYSGGKDSTAVLQLTYRMLLELPERQRMKPVHVICNDTLVEAPPILEHMTATMSAVRASAQYDRLPISTAMTSPPLKDRFFVKVIGRGYPAPTRVFRWCTDKMKIRPTNDYIKQQISECGDVIILLGTRSNESSQRARSIQQQQVLGGDGVLRRHPSLKSAFVYAPIEALDLEDVWSYLLQVPPPWGGTHKTLWLLYGRASGRDCPLVVEKNTQPCGNSRFGCWTCTVVRQDRSIEGLIDSGDEHLEPLLEYRNWLKEAREDHTLRMPERRDGKPVPGPFTLDARVLIFRRLIALEQSTGLPLLSTEEKAEIERLWTIDGYYGDSLAAVEADARAQCAT